MIKKTLAFITILCFLNGFSQTVYPTLGKVIPMDASFSKLISADAKIEMLASGFIWSEGPVWVKNGGYLLFSDPRQNTIFKWDAKNGLQTFLKPSGYTGNGYYSHEPGSNGLLINKAGELVACEQGDRRVSKMPLSGGGKTTVADHWDGKKFNSPNDIVQHSSGAYYFTDPAYGMDEDSKREITAYGVYRIGTDGKVIQLITDLDPANGIVFSPDEKTLYVSQTNAKAFITAYPVNADGSVGKGTIFFDFNKLNMKGGAPDGMKTDVNGNIFTGGGNGILVISPSGKLLGKVETGVPTANCAFGGDGYLYITAGSYVCRVKVETFGN